MQKRVLFLQHRFALLFQLSGSFNLIEIIALTSSARRSSLATKDRPYVYWQKRARSNTFNKAGVPGLTRDVYYTSRVTLLIALNKKLLRYQSTARGSFAPSTAL